VLLEDNPGMDEHQFWEFKADYPLHTLSPVTPNPNFPPQIFQSFVETVQKLSPQEFYSLCAACVSSPLLSIDAESALDDPRTEKFLDLLENADPTNVVKKVLTEDAKLLFSDLGQYTTAISEHPVALKPGNKIPFNREGLADYTPREDIPECSHAAGNFASALVKFMNIFDTRLHDGNCSINAFLIGLLGHDVEDKRKVPLEQLYKHVRDFRSKVVEYVKQNKEELTEKFGEDAVASLTETYDNMERPEWTSSIVWECAANIYKRPIVVYGCPFKPNDPFLIDEKGEIAPSAIFQPKKEQQGPPINLMHVEVHYLYLERR
jgi:hypothetical protein